MKINNTVEALCRKFVPFLTFAAACLMPPYDFSEKIKKTSEDSKMRKSITVALLLAAVAGALVTIYFYLARRERELNEYEEILFSDDLDEISANDLTDEPVVE